MSDFIRIAKIWGNVPLAGVNRHTGPGTTYPFFDRDHPLKRDQQVIILCYSEGETVTWTTPPFSGHPHGQENTSPAWDFVITSDQDTGGFVADVYVNTGADIRQQLGDQCTCEALRNQLPDSQPIG